MEIKKVPPSDYEQIYRLRDYSFPTVYDGDKKADFQYWVANSTTLGAYEQNQIIGQLLVLPLNMTVHEVNMPMGGIGFVATYPEHRNKGVMKQLIQRALESMRQQGQLVSVLAPFSVSFYRYFGWELFVDKVHYTVPRTTFPDFGKQLDEVKRFSFSVIDGQLFYDVQRFHNTMCAKKNGAMLRDLAWWKRIERRQPTSHFAVVYEQQEVIGYIRYTINQLTFDVQDFIVKNYSAHKALWRFMTAHAASVEKICGITSVKEQMGFLFQEPQYKRELTRDVMARIVDVEKFLQLYNWRAVEVNLYVQITDPFCEWNEALYEINKCGKITKDSEENVNKEHILMLTINHLSALLLGYITMERLVYLTNVTCKEEIIHHWERAIPSQAPTFYEYF
ncbi:GNAT family N-acetyltransferase [Solibacillus sp. R5-41]|uniref:GNAT family N-acetyltransferase n=1 Tax=Solibacillus sp. R5-41 TaxID=2048654 RepID=UPI000C128B6B|nr:GNAT family N-acetyltransferase [Solibacillus sp. R5-41]ATP41499.1 GNAT family N-acetyltransferase [Solibacillus sp. R5-41]